MAVVLRRAVFRYVTKSAPSRASSINTAPGDHRAGQDMWRKVFFFVGIPAVGLGMLNAYMGHQRDHHKPRPEFVPYEYLRMRTKRFPWGDGNHSLFHNPKVNPLPDGYEEEEEHH